MSYKRCSCPIWVYGTLEGRYIRRSVGTRVWDRALAKVGKWERSGTVELSVKESLEKFMENLEGAGWSAAHVGKYKLLRREMEKEFAERSIRSISVDDLTAYRKQWDMNALSARKKLERLRSFFRFCMERGWVSHNPAKLLTIAGANMAPTIPFTETEIEKILSALEKYPDHPRGRRNQVRAFVLLLRYSGLRIGDATALRRTSMKDGKVILYTAKTNTPVYVPLPARVGEALEKLPRYFDQDEYFFWNGRRTLKSAVSGWQRALSTLFGLAKVQGHPHQFRHTLAVDLLNKGVSLENVAAILGNSVRIAEKHYAPFVKSRQVALENEIQKVWSLG